MFKENKQKFSFSGRILSFKYAIKGILFLFKKEHNAWIHALVAVFATSAGFYFQITTNEWIAIVIIIGFVFAAEAFNTAIELLVDRISPDYDETAGKIKDLAAAAVLFTAIVAAIAGIVIFAPYLFN
jgi:diacylglycerol kinase (ATP)